AQMVELSLMYEGNYERIQKVIGKLRAGEEIRLAILGGSVTEGAGAGSNDKGYAYQFLDALAEEYAANGKDQILYVNAGLSGTPSVLGWMRYQQDVVTPLGGDPDLLIIEFAVNDWQEATNGRAYESMVYEALSAKEDAAVICLCSVAKTAWNTQDSYLTIAKHYQIPLVSLKKALFTPKNETRVAATKYFMDDYHPKFYGHELMKDCLMNLFAKADAAETAEPAEIPENAVKGRDFVNIVQVDSKTMVKGMKTGSFGDVDDKVVTMYFTNGKSFPNNFYHKAGSKNDALQMTVKCKKILINYKTSSDKSFGTAEFFIDGSLVKAAEGYSGGGWNNCNVLMVLDEDDAAKHTLEVKMAEDSLDKAFTILSISYCE
ncbi:MAG: SGNH/GDSL hydrolase family protein, partial [Lachnospiraceae bacterium]|nr:SGNH/GDSL hydrolase family protein [Lachnospiraceae bacterium]